jgi:beta-exotoxin I transport system permease protein
MMAAIFRYALRGFRGQILGWGIALFVLGCMFVPMYDVTLERRSQMEDLLKTMPQAFSAFVGDLNQIFEPAGYLDVRYFTLMPVVLGIFAVLAGSGLLASDEEKGILDLVLAYPLSRTQLFLGRLAAMIVATLAILFLAWLGLVVPLAWSALAVSPPALFLAMLSLLAVLLVYAGLALFLSFVLPARRLAGMTAGLVVIASYFIKAFAVLDPSLRPLASLFPLDYYQGGKAIHGLNLGWFAGLVGAAALLVTLAWWRFERKDIRVAGEGSWRLAFWRRRK